MALLLFAAFPNVAILQNVADLQLDGAFHRQEHLMIQLFQNHPFLQTRARGWGIQNS